MQIVLRAAALYLFVWIVMRAMGRKEISQLSSFDLILLIVMGDLIQQGVTGDDRSVVGAMLAVATMALLVLAASYASFRWRKVQPVIQGVPVVILQDGRPLRDVLDIERLTLDEVRDAAREQGIPDLGAVEMGVLEPDGKFSFLMQAGVRPNTKQEDRST
jgi:uncharacterized membrane protein YcaP (DUF421 family)